MNRRNFLKLIEKAATVTGVVLLIIGFCFGVDEFMEFSNKREARVAAERETEKWNGRCFDTSTLLATSSGSPSYQHCENKRHKMRVQVSSLAGKEIGAVVLCECQE